jgi:predicted transcriptional regulator
MTKRHIAAHHARTPHQQRRGWQKGGFQVVAESPLNGAAALLKKTFFGSRNSNKSRIQETHPPQ